MDRFVKNTLALQGFQERIVQDRKSAAIRYHVPECFLCWQCVGACPRHAIDVEYDDLDIREYLLPTESSTTFT
jgi:formate hydrogenlyase subunit 6/NADH:ubiquinone oxidoreductase subunit I